MNECKARSGEVPRETPLASELPAIAERNVTDKARGKR